MRFQLLLLSGASILTLSTAAHWPYDRYHSTTNAKGKWVADTSTPEFGDDAPGNWFGDLLHHFTKHQSSSDLHNVFVNGTVPPYASFHDIRHRLDVPEPSAPANTTTGPSQPSQKWSTQQAFELFEHLPFKLDPECLQDKSTWWYRTYDGSCNWIKQCERHEGSYGQPKSRDYGQYTYADGISEPRQGPNPRALSNAFFKRKETLYFEHTPLLLGLVEFIMHDVSWSPDSETEYIDVPMPDNEEDFAKNSTLRVWRTEAVPGTGTSRKKPRENINRATTWLDLSALYGSTADVAEKLRSFQKGKLLTNEVQARGTKKPASYLPFNSMKVPTRTRPGVSIESLFAGGDPRTNEDWVMLGVHTLFLREHNRLCDILAKQHPEYSDEDLYQTVRLLLSGKYFLIANAYQMAYFKNMTWPNDDGFPLYREMLGKSWLEINPSNNYPWHQASKNGKPTVVSAEMAVVYRFHEFIIRSFPIKDALNETIWDQRLFDTAFNSSGFINAGLENILRGVVSSTIPNFKSGVDEDFRSAGKYRGKPFDIVVSSIVHEREQGLPTFNNYFRAYNKADPEVKVAIRNRFEDFSSDPKMVQELKRLYKSPEEVDLVVGCQLDETLFPHATIPTSALIVSLFSLISMGNSDRFSIGFAAMRCMLVDKPWDCHPSNALEELLWKPAPTENHPNFRFYDSFWMTELDFQAHGQNLLWRLITENSEIKCLQQNPLFPVDPKTNPILCSLPKQRVNMMLIYSTAVEISLTLFKSHWFEVLFTLLFAAGGAFVLGKIKDRFHGYPHVLDGVPILGKAKCFQENSKAVILDGIKEFGRSKSAAFGIHLASLTHYLVSRPEDIQMLIDDTPYEMKFGLSEFFEAVNMPIILREDNFKSDLHTRLIRTHLTDPKTVQELGKTIEVAAKHYIKENPLVPAGSSSERHERLGGYLGRFVASICARVMVGADAYDHPELVELFVQFNKQVDNVMGMGIALPSCLRFLSKIPMSRSYRQFRKIFIPIIEKRRKDPKANQDGLLDFMPYILEIVEDNKRAADLVTITVWIGLRNIQIAVISAIFDIVNIPGLTGAIHSSLAGTSTDNLDTFGQDSSKGTSWGLLRSAVFESLRLCGSATGPARVITSKHDVPLVSDPTVKLPSREIVTLSSFYSHRLAINYGPDAAEYRPDRFVEHDPEIGSTKFISWGLQGPHTCPGRWFAQHAICVMVKTLLDEYDFEAERTGLVDHEKYKYMAGVVRRNSVPITVKKRGGHA